MKRESRDLAARPPRDPPTGPINSPLANLLCEGGYRHCLRRTVGERPCGATGPSRSSCRATFPTTGNPAPGPQGGSVCLETLADTHPLFSLRCTISSTKASLLRITLAPSPVLLEQCGDAGVSERGSTTSCAARVSSAESDARRFERAGEPHLVYLARY